MTVLPNNVTTTPTTSVAHTTDLTVRFPRSAAPALRGVTLDVAHGESILVLGTSGSGKSTLLRTIAGVIPHTIDADVGGAVIVPGTDCAPDQGRSPVVERAQQIAYVQQNPLDQLCMPTVRDEIAFGLENAGVAPRLMDERTRDALRKVDALNLIDRATATLSGGEGQRVALAAGIARDPKLLLLDEPTAMLDPAAASRVGKVIANLRTGPASILVEHRLDEIGALPQRTLVLTPHGSPLIDGPTPQVLPEHAKQLLELGCWLPLRLRLLATLNRSTPTLAAAPTTNELLTQLAARIMSTTASLARSTTTSPRTEAPGEVALKTTNLTVHANGTRLLTGVDLTLRSGTITAVVGRNGSGKSTLLRTLAGLTDATGNLETGRVGLVFQHPEHQFLTRSVRAELEYGTDKTGAGAIEGTLRDFGLDQVGEHDPFRLSGGQQRRLSLATMAVGDDEVLLLDEPTFGQDRAHTATLAEQMRKLAQSGRAVVIVTHDLNLVAQLADAVILLATGRSLAHGTPERILTDKELLTRAGIELPPLLEWCRNNRVPMRQLIQELK